MYILSIFFFPCLHSWLYEQRFSTFDIISYWPKQLRSLLFFYFKESKIILSQHIQAHVSRTRWYPKQQGRHDHSAVFLLGPAGPVSRPHLVRVMSQIHCSISHCHHLAGLVSLLLSPLQLPCFLQVPPVNLLLYNLHPCLPCQSSLHLFLGLFLIVFPLSLQSFRLSIMDSQLPVDLLKPVSMLLEVIQHGVGGHLNVIHLWVGSSCLSLVF